MDEQRRLLDELMGQERNLEESAKKHHVRHFSGCPGAHINAVPMV